MSKIIIWQSAVLLITVCLSAYFGNHTAMWSTLWGGLCYLIPTVIAIIGVMMMKRIPVLLPTVLLIAEIGKVVLASLMIFLIFECYPAINWLAFLAGLIMVSQAGLFTFRKRLLL